MALPAASATTPRIEKIPAPTMPPMPIETAAAMPICPPAELPPLELGEEAGGRSDELAGMELHFTNSRLLYGRAAARH